MFKEVQVLKKKCAFCDSKELYKYGICETCYDNLNLNVSFYKKFKYVDEIYIGCEYSSFLRDKMVKFKFKDETYLYSFFGELLIEKLLKNNLHKNYETITSVPMHKNSLNKRGYNQSELIAKYISENTLIDYRPLLKKDRETREQVELSSFERVENLRGVFSCREAVDGKSIIIVDDVITTGSTIEELAKVLKAAGAKKVAALVVATRQSF